MSDSPQKQKKQRNRTSKSRPFATSSISQPYIDDSRSNAVLSAFSPDARLFAFLSLAVDKHRLRVFDTNTNQSVAEYILDHARVTSLAWIRYAAIVQRAATDGENIPSRKRKKTASVAEDQQWTTGRHVEQMIALGLSDGSVQLFSVVQGRVLKTVTGANRKASVLVIAEDKLHEGGTRSIWTSSSDGVIQLWDLGSAEILFITGGEGSPYSALSVRPGLDSNQTHILVARNDIRLLSLSIDSTSSSSSGSDEIDEICLFNGHGTTVKSLLWEASSSPSITFYSSAESDRFIYLWNAPAAAVNQSTLIASCPLDADVLQIDVVSSPGRQILLALSSSGKVVLAPAPAELGLSMPTNDFAKRQVPILAPRTVVSLSKKASSDDRIAAVAFLRNDPGKICVAVVSAGVKLAFETLEYLDSAGEFIPEVVLKPKVSTFGLAKDSSGAVIATTRYTESSNIIVATGAETPYDPTMAAIAERDVEGNLDADLAELSLGQRLAARTDIVPGKPEPPLSGRDAENVAANGGSAITRPEAQHVQVAAHSLTRALIQALHAGDTSLLEACLTHSDEKLIRNTVTRMPPQLSIPLLTACVERMGRGPRGNNIKGRGGGASAQRGLSLMKWVRAVLIIHCGHLMTMPDLVARLSHLHSTLTTRLTLQDRLLSLSGRLDLVLAQAELRSSDAPAPLTMKEQKNKRRGKAMEPLRYIEGESSEEDRHEDEETQIEVEEDDEGSIEDVELDGNSEESEWDEENSEEDEEEEDANLMNGQPIEETDEEYDEDESDENND